MVIKIFKLKLLSAFLGILVALQSRINGELSDQMGVYLEAALVSFGTGLIFASLISLFRKDVREGYANILKQYNQNNFQRGDHALEC